ncbi:transcription antitermination factor NusB [Priestia flexa]|jgi:transcription antitermination protein NusB|uniref:Transcription antitermination protein NusB n=1 Tax=Priestia flexa TaxID=86664 RepID=A0A8I1MCR8_9BACI|nr:transcription antitermination factor NusB [Priestia flexa]MBN8250359.1 transcription antitermination factor NusB [Priestia flexa]MBN8432819.1 transcription antitermination factor NusB [Priestia flexa]MCA0965195.1 transcription antitermination factor NusB [Priestia flexa]RIV09840.1 transcription antitermination factor NusB [Priestia flexa]UIR29263.1 transcription antitermination factor NusB [Priestia flexa]
MKRHTARQKALQALFQHDLGQIEPLEAMENVLQEGKGDDFLEKLVLGVANNQKEIDGILRDHLEKWTLDRVATVDRTILRMAVYEMKYEEEIPGNVTMNEAIELAKVFGDDQSGRFINGVLSKVAVTLSR